MAKKISKTIIGLDLGSSSLKMVKGIKENGAIRILDFAHLAYAATSSASDIVPSDLSELLTSILDRKRAKKTEIHSTISGRNLCIRVVSLPILPKDELYQAVRSKIRKYISLELDEVVFSFAVLGETQEKDVSKLEIVFAALPKSLFEKYLSCFESAGIKPKIIIPSFFAGWNLIRHIGQNRGIDSLMLININKLVTDLTVIRQGRFVFTRNISVGSRDFMDSLGTGKLLQKEAEVLYKEIELTAYHYYQLAHGRKIDKVVVMGEGSQISGLIDFIKQRLEFSIETLGISGMVIELPQDKSEEFTRDFSIYAQALGTLLSSPEDINLLSESTGQAKKNLYPIKFLAPSKVTAVAMSVFISLYIFTFILLKGLNIYYQYQIKSYRIMQDTLQSQTVQLMQIKRKAQILDNEKKSYLKLIRGYPAYSAVIAEICKAIPSENVVLDELVFNSEPIGSRSQKGIPQIKFMIKARVVGNVAVSSDEVTIFVLTLEQSSYFENVSVAINEIDAFGQSPQKATKELSFIINGDIRLEV